MMAAVWTVAVCAWLAAWLVAASRSIATRNGDRVTIALAALLPAFVISSCLVAFAAVPFRHPTFHLITLWVHHASLLVLFAFLLGSELIQLDAWWRIRAGDSVCDVAVVYRRLWILTEIVPAPVASAIFLSGLRLMWDSPGADLLEQEWLLAILVLFALLFWDGLFGFRPIVGKLRSLWETAARGNRTLARTVASNHRATERVQLLTHTLTFPLVFACGVYRWNVPGPPGDYVRDIEAWFPFLSSAWQQIATAVLIWAVAGLAVIVLRRTR